MSVTDNALLAKAHSMYGRHLTSDDYNELLEKRSINEVVSYLKSNTDYAELFENVRDTDLHRGKVESLLTSEVFSRISRLIRYAKKTQQPFYLLAMNYEEINIILHTIRRLIYKRDQDINFVFPHSLKKYSSCDLEKLLYVTNSEDLLKVLKKSYYYPIVLKALENGLNQLNVNTLEFELTRAYYAKYFSVINGSFSGNEKTEIKNLIQTQLELENIIKIYRLKKYFKATPEEIRNVLIFKHCRFTRKFMESLIHSKDADDLLRKLENSPYSIKEENGNSYIEHYTNEMRYRLSKRLMHVSSSAAIVYQTYVFIHWMETENLKHIIEGLRYGEEPGEIRKLLIY